jgi:hypothetical protein
MQFRIRWAAAPLVLVFLILSFALTAVAQETMIGVHGGNWQSGSPGSVSTINQSNANMILIGEPYPEVGLTGVAINAAGRMFATTGYDRSAPDDAGRLIEIDPATGAFLGDIGRLQTQSGVGCWVGDLSVQPGSDILYGVLANDGEDEGRCGLNVETGGYLVTINTTNARVTVVGRDPSLENSNGGLAFRPDGTLFFTPCWDNDGLLLTLNPDTGAILSSRDLANDTCYMGLAARPSDGTLFASFNWESSWNPFVLATLNPNNGNATVFGHSYSSGIIHDLAFTDAIDYGFQINAGMSDSWFNADTAGQGFFISVFEDAGLIFMAWFTYETERPPADATASLGEPGHRWLTAQGPFDKDTASLTAYLSEGGVFDSVSPPVSPAVPIGTIEIVWHDCENATVSYDLDPPGVRGEIEIQRVVNDNAAYCEAYQP